MKRIFILLLTSLLLLSACHKKHENYVINILETSDVHGQIFPYNFVYNDTADHSLAQVYTYVKKVRSRAPEITILLDNGDIIQGDPTVYYYNFIDTTGKHIVARVFNFMGYDAATVGNHDIEAGHAVYDRLRNEFDFPWLSANAVRTDNGQPYFKPYTILKRGDLKIAVLGLTTPGIPNWLPENLYKGMVFKDMVKTARYWVNYIKENEHPDVLIGLFHAGHDWTYGGEDSSQCCNENASLLVAKNVPGFDVVLIGHDHDKFQTYVVNNAGDSVLVLDPASKARYISHAVITLTWDKNKKQYVKHITGKLVATDTIKPNEDFMKEFWNDYLTIKRYVRDTVGFLADTLDSRQAYFGDNAFLDLIHKVQLQISGADISFAAPLKFSAQIPAGAVTVGQMFNLYKYENMLYTMRLKGSEIKNYLEYSYSLWLDNNPQQDGHLLAFSEDGHRLKNRYYNFDNAEGINYTVDITKPVGDRITITGFTNGQPFDTAAYYTVAINSYRGNGGGGHLTRGAHIPHDSLPARVLKATDKDLRYYIMQYLENQKVYKPTTNNNWKFVPEKLATQLEQKDYQLLFGNNHQSVKSH